MGVDDVLIVGGFAIACVDLFIAIRALKKGRTRAGVVALVAVLVATTGLLLYRFQQHDALIRQISMEIIDIMDSESLTYDELHERLLFRSFPNVNEALFLLIRDGSIRHRLSRPQVEGRPAGVRLYYRNRTGDR
jgi:hypothetical protein